MRCEEFLQKWCEKGRYPIWRIPLLFHWWHCRNCRITLSSVKRISSLLKEERLTENDEAFFQAMREGLLEEARREIVSRDEKAAFKVKRRPFLSPKMLAPLGLVLVAICTTALFFLHSSKREEVTLSDLVPPGGEAAIVSQLEDRDIGILENELTLTLRGGAPLAYPVTPWAEVMDSVSTLSPEGLDFLIKGMGKQGAIIRKVKEV